MTQSSQNNVGIHQAISRVMMEVGSVGKTKTNASQNYRYRGISDVYRACQLVLAKHGVHFTPEEVTETRTEKDTKSGGRAQHVCLKVRFAFYAADGSHIHCTTIGEAIDSSDKAANKAMSAAAKYALIQVLCLPEEDPEADTEATSPEIVTKPPAKVALPIVPATKEAQQSPKA